MIEALQRFSDLSKVLTALVVLALSAAVFLLFANSGSEKTLVADFKGANSLYVGNEVRMMGVPFGKVTRIEPMGDRVSVTMEYDGQVKLPADAKAVVVAPSIVGDRFVQVGPAYDGGPALPNNARLGLDKTAVPVEMDDIFKSIDSLALALGPTGVNKDGALSRLVNSSAEQLDGQGGQLAETLENFARLSTTLNNNDEELFGSIREIDQFVALMRRNDDDVQDFFDSAAEVSEVLAGEREDLAATIEALREVLVEVRNFVRDNRASIRGNVANLESLAAVLAERSDEIDHLLAEAPGSSINVMAAGAQSAGQPGGLTGRMSLVDLLGSTDPISLICNALGEQAPGGGQLCTTLEGIISLIPADLLDQFFGTNALAGLLTVP